MLQLNEKPRDTQAWDLFLSKGLPQTEKEPFHYVRLKDLFSQTYDAPSFFELKNIEKAPHRLLFINGIFCPALSDIPKTLIVLPLSEAEKTYGTYLKSRIQKQLSEEKDPFALLNKAYSEEGLFLYVPPRAICQPITILHMFQPGLNPTFACPRIHLFAGKESVAKISFAQNVPEKACSNILFDIALEERSELTVNFVSKQASTAHAFCAFRATLKEKSILKTCSSTNGGATSREDYNVHLLGSEANAALSGLWELRGSLQHHVNIHMEHQAPLCTSLQKFKGILKEASRSSFEGKIYVHSVAQKTQAYQMNNNLILGEQASANSKPNLEIFADDVKASHGATVGQIDEEHLFYFKSRGLSTEQAHDLLIRGFSKEILDLFEEGEIKKLASEVAT